MSTPRSDHQPYRMAALSLTRKELEELDVFLNSDAISSGIQAVDALHGFLTSVALLPKEIPLDQWLPFVWNHSLDEPPYFENSSQAWRLTSYVTRMYDDIVAALSEPEGAFTPLVTIRKCRGQPYIDAQRWCNGFMRGIALLKASWAVFLATPAGSCLLLPIFLLGADSVPTEWKALAATPQQRASLTEWIPSAIQAIHAQLFMLELMALHEIQERTSAFASDLCWCGSNWAFKSCCGAPHRLH